MYRRRIGTLTSDTLLATKGDAIFAAAILNEQDPEHVYEAKPRMMGYEGADFGVTRYTRACKANRWRGQFVEWVPCAKLRELCKDRPIVDQDESWTVN